MMSRHSEAAVVPSIVARRSFDPVRQRMRSALTETLLDGPARPSCHATLGGGGRSSLNDSGAEFDYVIVGEVRPVACWPIG